MRPVFLMLAVTCLLLLASGIALAQDSDFSIPFATIDGGAGSSGNGEFSLRGTIGQPDAGILRDDTYTLYGGFWHPIVPITTPTTMTIIYALALDNEPTSPGNLSGYYPLVISALADATAKEPSKVAIVLADLANPQETYLLEIKGGKISYLDQRLPLTDKSVTEYDLTSGAQLGAFIKWAHTNYPADVTIFSYVGHGLALAPNLTPQSKSLGDLVTNTFTPTLSVAGIDDGIPLPSFRGIHPDWSDENPRKGLISPHELAEALQIGTDDGKNRLTVVDIVHCFAASIEEFYELSNPDGPGNPYADVIIGSPNYTYFAPELIAATTAAPRGNTIDPVAIAQDLVFAYDNELDIADHSDDQPNVEFTVQHPRIVVAVDSHKLQAANLKQDFIGLSTALWDHFDRDRLVRAYQNSAKYDTTFCKRDWLIAPPDAVSDLADFMEGLAAEYQDTPNIAALATEIATKIRGVVTLSIAKDGSPWFANVDASTQPKPYWMFDRSRIAGIGLYADFEGEQKESLRNLSFQSFWYTNDIPRTTKAGYPHNPYALVASGGSTEKNWSDIFNRMWAGQTVQTEACLPVLPPIQRTGDVAVKEIIYPISRPNIIAMNVNVPTRLAASIAITGEIPGVNVNFSVTAPDGRIVFTDVVGTGYLVTGTYQVNASQPYTPNAEETGLTVSTTVDPDDRYIGEVSDEDNTLSKQYDVAAFFSRPTLTVTVPSSWVSDGELRLSLVKDQNTERIESVEVQVYQYSGSPSVQVAELAFTQAYEVRLSDSQPSASIPVNVALLPHPGATEIHVLGISGANVTLPAIVNFNYIPPQASIGKGQDHYFLFDAKQGDRIGIHGAVAPGQPESANLFIWNPANFCQQIERDQGNDLCRPDNPDNTTLSINTTAKYSGQYVVNLHAEESLNYTLSVDPLISTAGIEAQQPDNPNGIASQNRYVPGARPVFLPPIPVPATVPPTFLHVYLPFVTNASSPALPDLVVEELVATPDNLKVLVRNQGEGYVTNDYWVDVYIYAGDPKDINKIDPTLIPTRTNQIWPGLAFQGMVWEVTAPAVPLPPGGVTELWFDGSYYTSTLSAFKPPLELGTIVFAQVDSANKDTSYGAVMETHERNGGQYNNISFTTVISGAISPTLQPSLLSTAANPATVLSTGRPVRPQVEIRTLPQTSPETIYDQPGLMVPYPETPFEEVIPQIEHETVQTGTIWLPIIERTKE